MSPNPQETADLVTFTEEIHNDQLHFSVQSHAASLNFLLTKVIRKLLVQLDRYLVVLWIPEEIVRFRYLTSVQFLSKKRIAGGIKLVLK